MRLLLRHSWIYLAPPGPSARLFVALYMVVTGVTRIVTGNTPAGGVNIFSARMFGLLLTLCGLGLVFTLPSKLRYRLVGRVGAITAAVLWVLLIAQAWPVGAWVSISGAACYVVILANEVRITGPQSNRVHV